MVIDIHHCESIGGENSKRQQWPSIFTIVSLLLSEIANVNSGRRYSLLWIYCWWKLQMSIMAIDIHHCTMYNRFSHLSIVKGRPIIYCWWRWLLMNTTGCLLLAAKTVDNQLVCSVVKWTSVASAISTVQGNSHLWTTLPNHCCGNGTLRPLPKSCCYRTISIDKQRCQPIVVNNINW